MYVHVSYFFSLLTFFPHWCRLRTVDFADQSITALSLLKRTLQTEAIKIASVSGCREIVNTGDIAQSAETLEVQLTVHIPIDWLETLEKRRAKILDVVARDPLRFRDAIGDAQ